MKKIKTLFIIIIAITAALSGCHSSNNGENPSTGGSSGAATDISASLTYTESMELVYAKEFSVDYYEEGYALITIAGSARYLLIPEGGELPEDVPEDITPIYQPVDQIYLVASAVMDMFISMDALDCVSFSGTDSDGWYLDEARSALESGDILYAGKYSAPDYELILDQGCDLAVENTMINHTPEVKEQLESFDIPVMVDYSSYESEPLGRTEWVKLYGLITGREAEAEAAFEEQRADFENIAGSDDTGLTVSFFYITTSGSVNVRNTTDYLPKMIEMAGGEYIFSDLSAYTDSDNSTVSMQMEEFYAGAKDADFIIYNSTIDGQIETVDQLLAKSELLANFKAVQEGNVYCTSRDLYQSSMELGTIIADIHGMLNGEEDLTYLYKLEQ